MATKKQKREAALAKREKFMAQYRADGLVAQQRAQEEYAAELRRIDEERTRIDDALPSRDLLIAIAISLYDSDQ